MAQTPEKEERTVEMLKGQIAKQMIDYFETDYRRITHALNVLHQAENIMEAEQKVDGDVIIAAALLHDIGIKKSEQIRGYNTGKTQEEYGPPVARNLLEEIGFPATKIARVCHLIGHHHSHADESDLELQILKQADQRVNKAEAQARKNDTDPLKSLP